MPREFTRAERVSDAVQQEIAVLIRDNVRDPRVGMLSVTDVDVSRDLAYAKVHIALWASVAKKILTLVLLR